MRLAKFLASPGISHSWVGEPDIKVYIRRSWRSLNYGYLVNCIDVATVSVSERRRGKGVFTRFLRRVETHAKRLQMHVYVESVLEQRFRDFFLKRGYTVVENTKGSCFYKSFKATPND